MLRSYCKILFFLIFLTFLLFKFLRSKEKAKIQSVISNPNFVKNPLDSLKSHIKTTQLLKERQKKIDETYQKNYNFLNMK